MTYRVAVALAVYNGKKWLNEQVKSILDQKNIDVSIYISIDPSSDGSEGLCLELSKSDNRIILLPFIPSSGCAAFNFFRILRTIDLSKYEYLSFSDQDDVWDKTKLYSAITIMRSKKNDCYSSNLTTFGEAMSKNGFIKKNYPIKKFDYLFQGASAGCTYVLSNKAALFVQEKVSLSSVVFPERPSHDWIVYAICRSYGFSWCFDSRSFILYRQHENNVRGALPGLRGYTKRLGIAKSGWYKQHIVGLEPFLNKSAEELKILNAVKKMALKDRLYLIFGVNEFRRRFKERIMLMIVFIFKMY